MDQENEEIEESIQIKDFNRKIQVNENDLIPIDDIVEETYAITYKNLLEQIKKDTFYEGIEYFKKVIREIISKELLEYESHTEKMYLKIISKLMGLKTETNNLDFNTLFEKLKATLIENLTQQPETEKNMKTSKISIYDTNKRDFDLASFQTLIDNLKEVFAENKSLEEAKRYVRRTFTRTDEFHRRYNSLINTHIKKIELEKELNLIIASATSYIESTQDLEFLAFNKNSKILNRLTEHDYLQGFPQGFQYWGADPSTDVYYSYHEFERKSIKMDIVTEKVELRFPRSLKEKNIYLNIMLTLQNNANSNAIMTKKVLLRFSENTNEKQYTTLFFYSGKEHNITKQLLVGWYKLHASIYSSDPNQDIPHLLKI
ncbi:DUF685 domain-containing protein (plasmid) [Borrelia anserina]|uniref:Uncharacterized protein n=2 Tax=Borrelia anserina TaxID=143 RepID=W5SVA7_BORAN|nr:DUF685 domain-containing protein [Borrelia anserina]AHH08951.1 Hypothetical protein BAN_0003800 [Borrelia anserina BA2]APR65383.1 hypothetical protein N187_A64 [Borrelia anserina Es]UPA07346.1 DUF685 domain-containing protein [Borrelia anserina]